MGVGFGDWWPWRRRGALTRSTVLLYTRAGCHLCDDALALLRSRQRRAGYTIAVRDITGDATLEAWYGEWVPVVLVDGKLRFRGRVNAVLLDRLIAAPAIALARRTIQ